MLILASKIYTGREVLGSGYIYIEDGIVKDLGEGAPPEEETYITVVLGGEGRVAAPGLALAASPISYMLKPYMVSPEDKLRLLKSIDLETLFTISLPAVYELHIYGVTTIFVESSSVDLPLMLAEKVGGLYGLALDSCWTLIETPKKPPKLAGLVRAGQCGGPEMMAGLLFSPSTLKTPWSVSESTRKSAGIGEGVIKEGRRAEIAIFNFSRPPGMLLYKADIDLNMLYSLGLKVETLISGEDVLVDGGEHLYIVDSHFKEATRIADRILSYH